MMDADEAGADLGRQRTDGFVSHLYVRELRLPDGVAPTDEPTEEQIQPILLD